jgi:ammonia channel protein AmtB
MDEDIAEAINGLWVFVAGVLCFLMQAGFGLLEVGSIRAKNAQNVLLKNIMVRNIMSESSILKQSHNIVVQSHNNKLYNNYYTTIYVYIY